MVEFVSREQAAALIQDGAHIWDNSFLALANPVELKAAIADRYQQTGHPCDLTFFCSSGFGDWQANSDAERLVTCGAVNSLIASHFRSTPMTGRMVRENRFAAYNLPLGVLSHMLRASASGQDILLSDVGLNLFVDPQYAGYGLNAKATETWVSDFEFKGKRHLLYRTPKLDIALIKGSSADEYGNITFEKEACTVDAMSAALAAHRNGGKVIVQVERILSEKRRPWEVIIPYMLVDYIVVVPEQQQIHGFPDFDPALSGDAFYSPHQLSQIVLARSSGYQPERRLVAMRAAQELKPGQIVNIGIGLPEEVGVVAAESGLLDKVALSVETGAFGGLPAGGKAFGAAIGAHSYYDMSQQFDFYDGGGLDLAFIGAMQIDGAGNVNGHDGGDTLIGVGGLVNITQATRKVVFCTTFTSGGLEVEEREDGIHILREGRHAKFVTQVRSISFSAENAIKGGQEILYITERCVFGLGERGLRLLEISPGVDLERDILTQLPFEVEIAINQ